MVELRCDSDGIHFDTSNCGIFALFLLCHRRVETEALCCCRLVIGIRDLNPTNLDRPSASPLDSDRIR